jgi:hypothetical protein
MSVSTCFVICFETPIPSPNGFPPLDAHGISIAMRDGMLSDSSWGSAVEVWFCHVSHGQFESIDLYAAAY